MSKAFAQSLKIVDFMDRFKTASSDECPLRENNSGSRGAEMFALEGTRANLSTRGVAVHTKRGLQKPQARFVYSVDRTHEARDGCGPGRRIVW
ncbi:MULTISPECIES: hypothetical protein [unclassified Caballeronia]|uniref:hypothetical protein n=1 Tax=unclassified Caballeronia TaxID=2646786 RepID=UPI0020288AA8|nr:MULTISPECIES: hypothetical protein [unclassified Caballeronia]